MNYQANVMLNSLVKSTSSGMVEKQTFQAPSLSLHQRIIYVLAINIVLLWKD